MKPTILKQLYQATQGHPFNETLLTTMMTEGLLDDLPDLKRFLIIAVFQYTTPGPWSKKHFSWDNNFLSLNEAINEDHRLEQVVTHQGLFRVIDLQKEKAQKRLERMQGVYAEYLDIRNSLEGHATAGELEGEDFYKTLLETPELHAELEEFYNNTITDSKTSMRDFFQYIHKIEGSYSEEAEVPLKLRYSFNTGSSGKKIYSLVFY